MPRLCSSLLLSLLIAWSASALTMEWTPIGNPGNACNLEPNNFCYGAVSYSYSIGTYEVTNAQYAEFLNAVAATDTNGLYNTQMGDASPFRYGGIIRSGGSGSYTYDTISGRADMPVNWVSFYDTLRFANWLHNGQLSGAQDNTTTEDGAYTITAQGISDNSIVRNAGATTFLTSEDEWYKAAYHNALGLATNDYFDYPAGSNTAITCTGPTGAANSANCDAPGNDASDPDVDDLTAVGSFTGSASPYGTFDQGGNAWEWNEAIYSGTNRGFRGGSFGPTFGSTNTLSASYRQENYPSTESGVGFRVARLAEIPEPGTGVLVIAGLLGLAGWRLPAARPNRLP